MSTVESNTVNWMLWSLAIMQYICRSQTTTSNNCCCCCHFLFNQTILCVHTGYATILKYLLWKTIGDFWSMIFMDTMPKKTMAKQSTSHCQVKGNCNSKQLQIYDSLLTALCCSSSFKVSFSLFLSSTSCSFWS